MIELRNLRHLLAVAHNPTVQAAADALHLTQPALTKSINRFEDELGAPLFDRRGRRLRLTELGERLVARGEDLLRNARHLEEEVEVWRDIGHGVASIGVGPVVELRLVPDVLSSFLASRPGVRVEVRSGDTATLLPALLSDEFHFVVSDFELADAQAEFEVRDLAGADLVAAVRPGHPLLDEGRPDAGGLDSAAMRAFPLATASMAPRFRSWSVEFWGVGGAHEPSIVCDNYEVLIRTAERSDCVVVGPRDLLAQPSERRLRVLPVALEGPRTGPSVIRCRGRLLPPAVEELLALFAGEALGERPGALPHVSS